MTYTLAELRVPAGATVHYQYHRLTLGGEGEALSSETRTFDTDTVVEERYAFRE